MVATSRIGRRWTPVNSYMKKISPDFIREHHSARTVTRGSSRETMMGAWMTGTIPPAAAGRC